MRRSIGLLAMAVVLSLGVSAKADIVWDFQNYGQNVTLGSTNVSFAGNVNGGGYNATYSLLASGYDVGTQPPLIIAGATAHKLFAKFTSGDPSETGLGLDNTAEHEIGQTNAVKLDYTTVLGLSNVMKTIKITLSSIQNGEGYAIYDTTGTGSTPLLSGVSDGTFTVKTFTLDTTTLGATVFYVAANMDGKGSNNILIESSVATLTPEPSTLAIAGLGALGFGVYALRRRRAAKASA